MFDILARAVRQLKERKGTAKVWLFAEKKRNQGSSTLHNNSKRYDISWGKSNEASERHA